MKEDPIGKLFQEEEKNEFRTRIINSCRTAYNLKTSRHLSLYNLPNISSRATSSRAIPKLGSVSES